ncbi:methyltransferase domain-containing protein [Spirosoma sp. KUDC1026]|nr:methyltransferase domain-containing protein [Spirosoma sp. KUDC1026]
METIAVCPVCDTNQFTNVLTCKDYLVSSQNFTIQQCNKCGFKFTNPRPDASTIGSYYKSDQYVSHNDTGGGLINSVYRLVRNYTLRGKVNLINKLTGRVGEVLDIGCGTGSFLLACQQAGWNITGVEPDTDARKVAEEKLSMPVEESIEMVEAKQNFDVISMWHVLEHMPDLNKVVSQLYSLLSNEGTVIIAVPNCASYDADYYKSYWAAYDVPRHFYHFTPDTITALFKKHGFTLTDQKQMPFDAFYISMLSSKYRTGKTNYVESMRVGLTSNSKASKTGQSSSITYVFKKA